MSLRSFVVTGAVALAASAVLAACGGSSGGGSSAKAGGGTKPLTSAACDQLQGVLADVALFATGQLDYKEDLAAIDDFADTVKLPDAYVKPVGTIRGFVDTYVSAAKDIGIPAGQPVLPDQAVKLKKKLHLPSTGDPVGHALQTLNAWTANSCQGSV